MNEENIEKHKFSKDSASKAREAGRAGGIASGEAKRKKRLLSEICDMIGAQRSDSVLLEGLPDDERTKDAAIVAAMYLGAAGGDTKAAQWVRDTKGESKVQVELAKAEPIDMSHLGFEE